MLKEDLIRELISCKLKTVEYIIEHLPPEVKKNMQHNLRMLVSSYYQAAGEFLASEKNDEENTELMPISIE